MLFIEEGASAGNAYLKFLDLGRLPQGIYANCFHVLELRPSWMIRSMTYANACEKRHMQRRGAMLIAVWFPWGSLQNLLRPLRAWRQGRDGVQMKGTTRLAGSLSQPPLREPRIRRSDCLRDIILLPCQWKIFADRHPFCEVVEPLSTMLAPGGERSSIAVGRAVGWQVAGVMKLLLQG